MVELSASITVSNGSNATLHVKPRSENRPVRHEQEWYEAEEGERACLEHRAKLPR